MQVIAWNSSYSNPADIPYIIYDYAPGVPLSVRWDDIAGRIAAAALGDIVLIELFGRSTKIRKRNLKLKAQWRSIAMDQWQTATGIAAGMPRSERIVDLVGAISIQ